MVAIRIDHILNFICEAFDLVVIIHSILDAHNLSLTQVLDIRRCLWHAVVKASHALGRASHEIAVARITVGHRLEHTATTASTGLCFYLARKDIAIDLCHLRIEGQATTSSKILLSTLLQLEHHIDIVALVCSSTGKHPIDECIHSTILEAAKAF